MNEYRWIAAYTKVSQETIAVEHIQRQSYQAYCPMVTRTQRRARRTEQVRRPLFPGYVFVRLDFSRDQWRPLRSTRGVRSLVQFGDRLGFLPELLMEEIQDYDRSGRLDELAAPEVKPGDQVTISEGPFHDLVAQVLALPENDRVWLLLDIMGQQIRVSQRLSALVPA